MSSTSAPNDTLSQLVDILGEADARDIVNTYLQEFPGLISTAAGGDHKAQHRAIHSLKSSSHHMGLLSLASRLEELEARLRVPESKIGDDDLAEINEEYERAAPALRQFANPQ